MSISVLILTKNEQEMIERCINSVLWADEIIIVDSQSTDETRSIATKKGAKVLVHEFKDFAESRNFAFKNTNKEWILYLDADERVGKELAAEIRLTIKNAKHQTYRLPRMNYYFGRLWPYQDYLERLFRKDSLLCWFGPIHESPRIKGTVGQLKSPLLHYTHRDLSSMLEKTIEWSKMEARLLFKANHPPVAWWRIVRVMLTSFLNSYVRQRGFKVGTVGLVESIYQAFSKAITYARLWEMQQEKSKK